jgi:hypothetical protein
MKVRLALSLARACKTLLKDLKILLWLKTPIFTVIRSSRWS